MKNKVSLVIGAGVGVVLMGTIGCMGLKEGQIEDLPPCEYEDSDNCFWDAKNRGNGEGQSFIVRNGELEYIEEADEPAEEPEIEEILEPELIISSEVDQTPEEPMPDLGDTHMELPVGVTVQFPNREYTYQLVEIGIPCWGIDTEDGIWECWFDGATGALSQ